MERRSLFGTDSLFVCAFNNTVGTVLSMAFTPELTYKGRPLVRCRNEVYYGSMQDPYVVYLQILTTKQENGVQLADKVHVALIETEKLKRFLSGEMFKPDFMIRQANRSGLWSALNFGDIMLQGALQGK